MSSAASSQSGANWEQILMDRLPLYGHRNWIVVADCRLSRTIALGH